MSVTIYFMCWMMAQPVTDGALQRPAKFECETTSTGAFGDRSFFITLNDQGKPIAWPVRCKPEIFAASLTKCERDR